MIDTVEGSSSQAGSGTLQDLCQSRAVHAATNDSNCFGIWSRHSALRKKAAKCQRKKVSMYKLALEKATVLEELLHDVCLALSPQPIDYDARRNLIRVFNEIALEIYGCSGDVPVVVEFGSFSMDLFQEKSDLDLSINFSDLDIPHDKKIQTLCTFEKKLSLLQCSGHVYGVNPITTAKVPVLKVVDSGTGIECDISVGNMDGILKSKTLYFISLIDERFRKLCFLMKAWAKAQNINSARDRTLNSLSIILLVAFHLQTRNPRILPPFSAILKDGYDAGAVEKSISKFKNYGQKNTEGVAELFFTLLLKLSSVKKLWSQGLCASTYDGNWIFKTRGRKAACIRVEDFHDGDQNVSRAVGVGEMKTIYNCIDLSINHISEFLGGRMEGYTLREFLFGKDGAISVCKVPMNFNADGLITLWPPPRIEDKDTDFQKSTQPGDHRNLSKQPCSKNFNAGEAKTEMPLNETRIDDKDSSGLKSTQQPGEGRDQSAQPSSKNFNANVAKSEVPLSTTGIQDIEDKDASGLKSTQQGGGWDQSAQPSSKNFNADMVKTEMPLNETRIDYKHSSGLKSAQRPGESMDQSAQPSKNNCNANVAKDEVPLSTTRIQDIEDKDTSVLKSTQQGEGWDQSTQPSSKNFNADMAKTEMPLNATKIDRKDSSGRKQTKQPNKGRDQSSQRSRNQTTSGKRKRSDGSSLPSTLFGKPHGYGKMKSQCSMPYDMSRREHIEHQGVLSWDGLGRTPHVLNGAGHTLPTHPNETRHTSAYGELCYHETDRIPYLPTPVSYPIYASSGTRNWISSGYTREADIATTFATQMVYPDYYHYNQLHFRAPHFATPSVYPTSTPIVTQMVPNCAHGTYGAGNFPSASMMPGYPPNLLYRTNSSHPQVNSSTNELAWFR
ncbi:hypothetical protein DM860_007793 [Cuscuta australis]|uniref:Poly(A) RNA polymerase mitochondrial-like central palm domain-containing protein n=1 Tax=Cuscuta australis TaxID=267555 RepID=A0A328E0I6_9ASTE|nr:hypothetical protein DM860_007793 [Cuscuta australis]